MRWAKGLQADVLSLNEFNARGISGCRVIDLQEQFLALVSVPCLVILTIFYLNILLGFSCCVRECPYPLFCVFCPPA
jgi:hypothetical protein